MRSKSLSKQLHRRFCAYITETPEKYFKNLLDFHKIKIQPRVPELQALHGKPLIRITAPPNFSLVNPQIRCAIKTATDLKLVTISSDWQTVTKTNDNKSQSLSRYLTHMGFTSDLVSQACAKLKPQVYTLSMSVSFKTIMNASRGTGWRSCYDVDNIVELLANPYQAILWQRSKRGFVELRWFIHWLKEEKVFILQPYPYPIKDMVTTSGYNITALTDAPIYQCNFITKSYPDNLDQRDFNFRNRPETRVNILYNEFVARAFYFDGFVQVPRETTNKN